MRLIEFSNQSVSFADCKAILLMLRWRAISSSKYISIDASIISKNIDNRVGGGD